MPGPAIHPLSVLAEAIPDLRPLEDLLPPTYWEQHRAAILLGGGLTLAILWLAIGWWRHKRPVIELSAADAARQVLRPLANGPDNQVAAGAVLKTLRGYLPSAIPTLPGGELTAEEIIVNLRSEPSWPAELREEICHLLRQCDQRHFLNGRFEPPLRLATRALEVIEKIEAAKLQSAIPAAPPR